MKQFKSICAVFIAPMLALMMFTSCKDDEISISSIEISSESETIKVGDMVVLSYTYEPSDAKPESAIWSSSDETVATVDQNGVVTGVADGITDITVTVNGKYTATCVVTVETMCTYSEILEMSEYIGKSSQDVRTALTGNGWTEVGSSFNFDKTINDNSVRLLVSNSDDASPICEEIVAYIPDEEYIENAKELIIAATDTYEFETLDKTAVFNQFSGKISEGNYDETQSYTEATNWLNSRTYSSFSGVWISTSPADYNGLIIQTNPDNVLITVALGNIY